MNITICNFKGGVGKSIIAHQLITSYNFNGVEIDPYGSLAERLPEKVIKGDLNAQLLPREEFENTIFDFGGFDTHKLDIAIKHSDLVIIPFIPTLESIQATADTLHRVKKMNKPILLVANMSQKQEDIEDAMNAFTEHLGFELDHFSIPLSVGLQTAINNNVSVLELAKEGGLKGFTYKKIANIFKSLKEKIDEYKS